MLLVQRLGWHLYAHSWLCAWFLGALKASRDVFWAVTVVQRPPQSGPLGPSGLGTRRWSPLEAAPVEAAVLGRRGGGRKLPAGAAEGWAEIGKWRFSEDGERVFLLRGCLGLLHPWRGVLVRLRLWECELAPRRCGCPRSCSGQEA